MPEVDILAVLEECLRNPATMEEAEKSGLIAYYEEPAYSLSVLRSLEERYGVRTSHVVMGLVPLDENVRAKWMFNWEIYCQAVGPEAQERLEQYYFFLEEAMDEPAEGGVPPALHPSQSNCLVSIPA